MKRVHVATAVAACMFWGGNAVINKIGLGDIPPLTLALLRFSFALPFLPFFKRPDVPLHKLALVSLAMAGQWIAFNLALTLGCSASLCSLLTQAGAGLSYLFSFLFFGSKPARENYITLSLSALGIALLGFDAHKSTTLAGVICALLVAACFGLVAVLTKWAQPQGQSALKDDIAFSVWAGALTFLFLIPFVVIFEGHTALASVLHISLTCALCAGYSGLVANLLGMIIFSSLIRRYSAPEVTEFTALVPIFAIAGGWLFLGEVITPNIIAAAALIIGGLLIGKMKKAR